jgi:hypothetical protein
MAGGRQLRDCSGSRSPEWGRSSRHVRGQCASVGRSSRCAPILIVAQGYGSAVQRTEAQVIRNGESAQQMDFMEEAMSVLVAEQRRQLAADFPGWEIAREHDGRWVANHSYAPALHGQTTEELRTRLNAYAAGRAERRAE